jgi:hypothetical protein
MPAGPSQSNPGLLVQGTSPQLYEPIFDSRMMDNSFGNHDAVTPGPNVGMLLYFVFHNDEIQYK